MRSWLEAMPVETPFAAPFVGPSAAGLHVSERPLDGELANGTPRTMRRRRAPERGEG